jgi:hypothetical protein
MKNPSRPEQDLVHGEWLEQARLAAGTRRFSSPQFGLLVAFLVLYVGSSFLFEHLPVGDRLLYAAKFVVGTLFAVSLGFILSVWWSTATRVDRRFREAERLDREYRDLLFNFSDNLFHIVNALNTLAVAPPRPFVVATEFLLGEYVGLLQTRLQRYGDQVAGLGFEANAFLDEKVRIFNGIRERASLSIKGMPKEIQTLFIDQLILGHGDKARARERRRYSLRQKLEEVADESARTVKAGPPEGAPREERAREAALQPTGPSLETRGG